MSLGEVEPRSSITPWLSFLFMRPASHATTLQHNNYICKIMQVTSKGEEEHFQYPHRIVSAPEQLVAWSKSIFLGREWHGFECPSSLRLNMFPVVLVVMTLLPASLFAVSYSEMKLVSPS